jgi:hypothetical protein
MSEEFVVVSDFDVAGQDTIGANIVAFSHLDVWSDYSGGMDTIIA